MAAKRNISPRQLSFPFNPAAAAAGSLKLDLEKRLAVKLGRNVRVIYTDNHRTMISARNGLNGGLVVRAHHMFRLANGKIVTAIAQYLTKRDRDSSELLGDFIKDNHHLVRRRSHSLRPGIETKGQFHDLASYYEKLNRRYFKNSLNEVAITWGQRTRRRGRNHIRLGSYSFEHHLIRIHPALDKEWVPRYYVMSVIHHEMLHAEFGVRSRNGRCLYHTDEFEEREHQFKHYCRAREWEKRHIRRLL